MNRMLVCCAHCGKSTAPVWDVRQEENFNTKGMVIYRISKILIKTEDIREHRTISVSMDEDLIGKIGADHLAGLIATGLRKQVEGLK